MQETFTAVVHSARSYKPTALVRTWLYSIALKQISNERRRQSRGTAVSLSDALAEPPDGRDEALWIRQALDALDPGEREILMLREYEQLSYQEIAELLNIPVNTVRSRLFRARMALKEILDPTQRAKGVR